MIKLGAETGSGVFLWMSNIHGCWREVYDGVLGVTWAPRKRTPERPELKQRQRPVFSSGHETFRDRPQRRQFRDVRARVSAIQLPVMAPEWFLQLRIPALKGGGEGTRVKGPLKLLKTLWRGFPASSCQEQVKYAVSISFTALEVLCIRSHTPSARWEAANLELCLMLP